MDDAATRQVRAFNRSVTQRIGGLTTSTSPAAGRSVPRGCCGRSAPRAPTCAPLRARLDLDSGYLSRLVRSLEQRRSSSSSSPARRDRRVRTVRLTDGRARRARAARPPQRRARRPRCSSAQRGPARRLVEAMGVVERLLTAGMVAVAVEDPASAAARFCIESYFAELDSRFDAGFDPSQQHLGRRRGAHRARRAAPRRAAARRAGRVRRPEAPRTAAGRDQAHVGRAGRSRAGRRAPHPRRARGPRAPARRRPSCGWRPTGRSARPARCTARRATPRSRPSTTSPTPITGSRSAFALRSRASVGHRPSTRRIASRSAAVTESAYLSLTETWRAT